MKIAFVKPNIGRMEHSLYVDEGRMEPLQIGVLAALTPPHVEVVLYDDRMEDIPYDEPADLVAITVETYTARRAYEIAAEFRARGVPVILGGVHVTLIPDEARAHADSIMLGDAETIWAEIVADAAGGRLKPVYRAPPGVPQSGVRTRRDIFEGKGYLPMTLTQFSRGCHFACNFCAVSSYFDKRHYHRPVREVVAEIEAQERKLVFIVDDNVAANRDALKELCRALIPLRIKWFSQASLDVTRDLELMKLMERSGCIGHVFGFESLQRDNLRWMNKSPNIGSFDQYETQIRIIRDHGLQSWAAFTLGHDHDTGDSIKATLDFALENRFAFAAFNILMPYPGTPLYDELAADGRLLYEGKWWLHPEYRFNHAAFVPRAMTPEQLTDGCHRARSEFNGVGGILRRLMDPYKLRSISKTAIYLTYAELFRREAHKKHGMRFGLRKNASHP